MKNQETSSRQQHQMELGVLANAFESIYKGKSKEISFSDTHNCVYKLCRKGMGERILTLLNSVSVEYFGRAQTAVANSDQIVEYEEMFGSFREAGDRITEVLLYLQSSLKNEPKKQPLTLRDTLNAKFFQQLTTHKTILRNVARIISENRVGRTESKASGLISSVNSLDDKEVFLPNFLLPEYIPLISQHLRNLLELDYNRYETRQFLVMCKNVYKEQREWLRANFARNKGKKLVDEAFKRIFAESFDALKARIYKQKVGQIFKDCILEFLEVLDEKKQEKEINDFNEWYVGYAKQNLSKIDRTDNNRFLTEFIKYYEQTSHNLSAVKNFPISYKGVFFFEHWINEQKINLPKRLNVYYQKMLVSEGDRTRQIKNFMTLFIFLKDKDYFEKEFRRNSIYRMIHNLDRSCTETESKIIDLIDKQCGADWVQKIRLLNAAVEESKTITNSLGPRFRPLVFDETCWPFDRIKGQTVLVPELLLLADSYKQKYESAFKGRVLSWHPLLGEVTLTIRFDDGIQELKVDVVAATILLNLQSFNFRTNIEHVLTRTKLNHQDALEQLRQLYKSGIIKIEGDLSLPNILAYPIELNKSYTPAPGQLSLISAYISEEFLDKPEYEELKAERKMMVESFIVKLMKSHKVMSLAEMEAQIAPLIENRGFRFNNQFVMNCFNGLIDKRFIRDMEDGNFTYLAS